MTVDFSNLLNRPSGTGKRPKTLPVGNYPGKIKGWKFDERTNKEGQKSSVLTITCCPVEWPDNIDDSDKVQEAPDGSIQPINLLGRTLSRDIYTQGKDGSDMMYIVDDLLKSCGIELGRAYSETLPELIGKDCILQIGVYVSPTSGEPGNQLNKLTGVIS